MYSKDLIKGTLKPIILKLLEDNGRMYGYQITQEVKVLSGGKIEITEGALYPLLHKLESEKIVKVEKEAIGKRVRKYYSLSSDGKAVSQEKVEELNDFIQTIGKLLKTKPQSI
ncbi:MAG: PadR family transcriptional regulator [Crocinitomicaceae bacterium]